MLFNLHLFTGILKRDDGQFNVRLNENGTRFTEKISINEKENTISFVVPEHNDIDRSEVLHDFNLVRKYA